MHPIHPIHPIHLIPLINRGLEHGTVGYVAEDATIKPHSTPNTSNTPIDL